jgi:hypothetical protein
MLLAVFGPRSRLGRALCDAAELRAHRILLVARDAEEAEWIAANRPGAETLNAWEPSPSLPQGVSRIGVACCAFGVIHPGPPDPCSDAAAALRDLRLIEVVLRAYRDRDVHVAFVSSVLALSPRRERAYYAGWKSVLQESIAAVVRPFPRARLSVLYPGRLVEERSFRRPASLLHSGYRQFGSALLETLESGAPRRHVIGLDARLWLAARGAAAFTHAATRKA